jgi:hypothetical protein
LVILSGFESSTSCTTRALTGAVFLRLVPAELFADAVVRDQICEHDPAPLKLPLPCAVRNPGQKVRQWDIGPVFHDEIALTVLAFATTSITSQLYPGFGIYVEKLRAGHRWKLRQLVRDALVEKRTGENGIFAKHFVHGS